MGVRCSPTSNPIESLRSIPVIVLTTSQDEQDVQEAYECVCELLYRQANRSGAVSSLLLKSIEQFWFQIVRLPLEES